MAWLAVQIEAATFVCGKWDRAGTAQLCPGLSGPGSVSGSAYRLEGSVTVSESRPPFPLSVNEPKDF